MLPRHCSIEKEVKIKKEETIKKDEVVEDEDSIMTSAPLWNEKLASESEACIKADLEPQIDVQHLEVKSTKWFRDHKDQ
ncbi:hypothetical protein EC973_009462 [Apophysomyces ossiformis]|uniref:Uncharacterized protein n=1 Tax=Apophysomyces ossiformis TaxID=679940 RepID=A0A8H7EPK4_9FUNG|nr:hypothetical protein EC973_009462 [Apophysomyces ossiformis]